MNVKMLEILTGVMTDFKFAFNRKIQFLRNVDRENK